MNKPLDTDKLRAEWTRHGTRHGNRTHFDGCHLTHWSCAIALLCDEVDRLRKEIDEGEGFLNRTYDE